MPPMTMEESIETTNFHSNNVHHFSIKLYLSIKIINKPSFLNVSFKQVIKQLCLEFIAENLRKSTGVKNELSIKEQRLLGIECAKNEAQVQDIYRRVCKWN